MNNALSSALSVGAGLISAAGAQKMNEQNVSFQQRENEITRAREDSAYQRAVSDARKAGLSPLAVLGTGGASSQALTAPQVSENPNAQGVSTFLQSENNHAIVAYNNAQASKAIEETRGQAISNAFAEQDYSNRILKLIEETNKIKVDTEREREFLREYRQRLAEELKGVQLSNSAKSQDIAFKAHDAEIFKKYGLPYSTNLSTSLRFGDKYALGFLAGNKIVDVASNAKVADKVKEGA